MEDCAVKCQGNNNCFFWTWFNKDAGEMALKCFIMSDFGTTESDSYATSADKNCDLGKLLLFLDRGHLSLSIGFLFVLHIIYLFCLF